MTMSRTARWPMLVGLVLAAQLAGAQPWQLHPVSVDRPTTVDLDLDGLRIEQLTLQQTGSGPAADLQLRVAGRGGTSGLMLVAFDRARKPLAAGYEQLSLPRLIGRRTLLESSFRLTIELGPLPDGEQVAYLAVGPLTQPVDLTNLLASAAGARVVAQSSSYGGSFTPERVLDGDPRTQWATATGKIRDEWLVVELAGGRSHRLSAIGINPWGEANYTNCALARFTLQVSTTGTAPEDFKTVLSNACAFADQLQRFSFEPFEARYLKLICHTNHGNEQWIELSSFEAYPEAGPSRQPRELAVLLEPVGQPVPPATDEPGRSAAEAMQPIILDVIDPATPPAPDGLAAPALEQVGCRSAQAEWRHETTAERDLRYLHVSYDFGMLLGGAHQLCAAVVSDLTVGQPARLQFEARLDPPGNRLRVAVWDSREQWFEFGVETTGRGWRRHWIDLDTASISKRSTPDAPVYPWTKVAIGVAPKGRDGTGGAFDLDDAILLYPAP